MPDNVKTSKCFRINEVGDTRIELWHDRNNIIGVIIVAKHCRATDFKTWPINAIISLKEANAWADTQVTKAQKIRDDADKQVTGEQS